VKLGLFGALAEHHVGQIAPAVPASGVVTRKLRVVRYIPTARALLYLARRNGGARW
jgi:hypothetical protein